jgi:ATP-dependent Clp protease ATP-binding subunit ClpC
MRVTLPILFERAEKKAVFKVRPLLFPFESCEGKVLKRALDRLARELKKQFRGLTPQELTTRCSYPALEVHRIRVTATVRKSTLDERFLAVTFPSEIGRVCFLPAFDPLSSAWRKTGVKVPLALRHGLWFLAKRGDGIEGPVRELLERIFRKHPELQPDHFKLQGWTDVTPLQLHAEIPADLKLKESDGGLGQLLLGGQTKFSGAQELSETASNLTQLYPEQLQRSFLRGAATESLEQLLWARQKRATLILGPRGVGKTALIHEAVYRHEDQREKEKRKRGKQEIFELNPRLVIAGMSYVGQWQQRLLAILKEVVKGDHVLVVTDLLDLFRVGRSSGSDISLATMIKPFIERNRIRFVAEATPEVFRILKEQDRAFADMFKVVRLDPCDDAETMSILIRTLRPLERDYGVQMSADALARTVELQRRFVRSQVFPGKAVKFLAALARRFRGANRQITSRYATKLFAEWSGLSLGILSSSQSLPGEVILNALESRVIGQREACAAITDTILLTKAGLNNPEKPLGTFLFIGPTGVGKTEAAKAAASYLYGSKERLLRFDMNEYPDAASVSRLIGTGFKEDGEAADGQLTGRVRMRPFSVVLFDEIEKAHPSIYDLLLQVLDEGHLTDAAGRMADFSNTIIILTSNLGVLRARGVADLPGGEAMTRGIYREEVERFFRPEFVNRLDQIIPFGSLKSVEIQRIARLVVEEALGREGLRRRRVVLNLDRYVIDKLVEMGTDEDLGARPLKRAVTRLIMEPLGRQLAATTPAQTTIAWVRSNKDKGLDVSLQILQAQALLPLPEGECDLEDHHLAEIIDEGLKSLSEQLRDAGEGQKLIDLADIRPGVRMRYRLLEELDDLQTRFDELRPQRRGGDRSSRRFRGSETAAKQRRTTREKIRRIDGPSLVREPDDDLDDFLKGQSRSKVNSDEQMRRLQEIRRYAAALAKLRSTVTVEKAEGCLIGLWSLAPLRGQKYLDLLADAYREMANLFGHEGDIVRLGSEHASSLKSEQHYVGLWVKGADPRALFESEAGIHVFLPRGSGPVPLAVQCFRGESGTIEFNHQIQSQFLGAILAGEAALQSNETMRRYEIVDDPSAPREESDSGEGGMDRLHGIESKDATPFSRGLKRSSDLPKSYQKLEILLRVDDHRSQLTELFKWPLRDLLPFVELLFHVFPLPNEKMIEPITKDLE